MSIFNRLYHLMRADFYERIRRYNFFIVVAITIYLGIMAMPSLNANYITVSIASSRGVYNSAWIGTIFGLMLATLVPLLGFFIIRTSIERDRHTRVGSIIASTQVSNLTYLLGKALSNFAILLLIMGIVMIVAPIMQLIRAEDLAVNLFDIWIPIILIFVPVAALVSVLGILFETIPFLRGGVGNIIYIIAFMLLLVSSETGTSNDLSNIDPLGVSVALQSIEQAYETQVGEVSTGINIGFTSYEGGYTNFEWDGVQWTSAFVLQRLMYILISFGFLLPIALFFDRFANNQVSKQETKKKPFWDKFTGTQAIDDTFDQVATHSEISVTSLTPLQNHRYHLRFVSIVIAELKLFLKGQSRWLLLLIIGLNIASIFSQTSFVLAGLMPIIWILPILIWSQLGVREYLNNTHQIIFSVANPIRGQFIALWVASVIFTILVGSGAGIHFMINSEFGHLFGWVATVLFIPSFALASGVLSNSKRLFEVSYLFLWYIAMNDFITLDFMSHTPNAIDAGIPLIYLSIGIGFLLIALFKRRLSLGI